METFARQRKNGESDQRALCVIETLYPYGIYETVKRDTKEGAFKHRFAKMQCYDCETCPLSKSEDCQG